MEVSARNVDEDEGWKSRLHAAHTGKSHWGSFEKGLCYRKNSLTPALTHAIFVGERQQKRSLRNASKKVQENSAGNLVFSGSMKGIDSCRVGDVNV